MVPCETKESAQVRALDALLSGFAFSTFLAYLEVLRAYRSDLFAGTEAVHWGALLVATVACTFLIAILAVTIAAALRVLGFRGVAAAGFPWWAAGATAIVWAILTVFGGSRGAVLCVGVGGCAVLAAAMAAFPKLRGGTLGAVAGIVSCALLGAMGVVVWSTHMSYLNPSRSVIAALFSMGYLVLAASVGIIGWALLSGSRKAGVKPLLLLCIACGPGIVGLATTRCTGRAASDSSEGRPNLVLVTFDALRADYCSVYGGHVATPNLVLLAQEGVRFERAYALAPWTLPSMMGLFSSEYPPGLSPDATRDEWKVELGQYWTPWEARSLAEELEERHGYATAAFVGNPVLRRRDGALKGFQDCAVHDHLAVERRGPLNLLPTVRDALTRFVPGRFPLRPIDTSRLLTTQAVSFLRGCGDRPFFLWVHYMDPHDPYDPPERYREMAGPWPLFCPAKEGWGTPQWDERGLVSVEEADKPFVRSLYAGEIRYVDECLGRIVDTIDGLGLRERTVVCVTSDHGEELWDHGRYGHGFAIYEEHVHVPLIVAAPGMGSGNVESPTSHLDLMPTLAALVGCEPPATWRGTSLVERMRGEGEENARYCFTHATDHRCDEEPLQAILAPDSLKLVRGIRSGECALFDLNADPPEAEDRSSDYPDRTQALLNRLDSWAESLPATLELPAAQETTEELQRQLEAVGYLK